MEDLEKLEIETYRGYIICKNKFTGLQEVYAESGKVFCCSFKDKIKAKKFIDDRH